MAICAPKLIIEPLVILKGLLLSEFFAEINNVTFKRGDRVILDDVTIRVPRGKVTAILGPSGCGKTTFLKLLGAQLQPSKGHVIFDGQSINALSRIKLFEARKKMGMLFQSGALFTDLNVFENVAFPLRVHTNLSEESLRDVVLMKLEAVGLRGAIDLHPSELSGGMARRVALARAIALDPEIILYDEPFVGQDPITMGVLLRLIRSLNDALGLTSLVVSHDVKETCEIADYIYLLGGGHVIEHGAPQALLSSANPQVQQFMKGLPDGPVPFHFPAQPVINDFLGT